MLKKLISLLLSVFILLCVSACDDTDKAYIYFQLPEKPASLDPQVASSETELLIIRNIFEGLLRKNEKGEIVCGVASEYKKNGLTYTFKLRKDAQWHDETPITAHDFEFAFKRAVSPETKSPFASRLFCIKNAAGIYTSKSNIDSLGVTATDKHTLKIELAYEDENFLETLTTSITMPCNEKFFYESAGKYGIFTDNTLSNGSYKLSKWAKDIFGIRLYKNSNYKGDFTAKNAAVFLSYSDELTPSDILIEDDADMAFVSSYEIERLKNENLQVKSFDNICWFLTISDNIPSDIRKSFAILSNGNVFQKSLKEGYSVANSLFPPVLNSGVEMSGMQIYDLNAAKELYSNEIKKLPDKKLPSITLYYYDDGFSKQVVTGIVGHWQNNLGAFINIESVSSANLLTSQISNQTYNMAIFPVSANSPKMAEYLQKFGVQYKSQDLVKLQIDTLKSNNVVPIMFQSTSVAYTKNLNNVVFEHGNGCIDFAFIIKKDD